MRRVALAAAIGIVLPAAGYADLYVQRAARTTAYVDGAEVGDRNGDFVETWIGDGRIASHEGNKTILLNLRENWFCILNHLEKSYVKTPLPLDLPEILSEDLRAERRRLSVSAEVRRTGRTREIASLSCEEYKVTYWDVRDGVWSDERVLKVWATEDLAFDEKAYHEMLECMRRLHNRDDAALAELDKIKGLQVSFETTNDGGAVNSTFVMEAVAVSEKEPPEGVYSIPEGYVRKEHLSDRDF